MVGEAHNNKSNKKKKKDKYNKTTKKENRNKITIVGIHEICKQYSNRNCNERLRGTDVFSPVPTYPEYRACGFGDRSVIN